eukprot:1160412-Pelagomonas_calceolata.AAC.12
MEVAGRDALSMSASFFPFSSAFVDVHRLGLKIEGWACAKSLLSLLQPPLEPLLTNAQPPLPNSRASTWQHLKEMIRERAQIV